MAKNAKKKDDRMRKMRNRAKEQTQERTTGGSNYINLPKGVEFFQLEFDKKKKKASIMVSVLPFETAAYNHPDQVEPGSLYYKRTYYRHANVGPGELKVVCPAKTFHKPCPICEDLTLLNQDKDANENLIKAIKPKQRELFLLYDHDGDGKTLNLWDISFHVFGKMLESEIDELEDDDPWFADPDDQVAISARMTDEFYGNAERIDFEPFKKPLPDFAINHGHDLANFLVELPYDKIKALYEGEEEEGGADAGGEKSRDKKKRDDDEEEDRRERKQDRKNRKEEDDDDNDEPSKDECPEGYEFGADYGTQRRCRRCDVADECEKAAPAKEGDDDDKNDDKNDDKTDDENECPEGLKFGHDCNTSNKCRKCPKWDDCDDLKMELEKDDK